MKLPNVLIINQPFNNDTGGGITLTNLFKGWDKDKLAVVCHNFLLENVDTSVCNTYYQLGHKEHKFMFPFNILKRKHYSGLLQFDKNKNKTLKIVRPKFRVKLIMNYFYPILRYLGLINGISKIELSPDICNWLSDFKPDIIYSQATSREGIAIILLIHSYLKKPLVFHMMDDWPSIVLDKGLLKKRELKKNDQEFRKLLAKVNVLMSVSDEMANEYKRRYGKNFITFHNPIDIEFWKKYQRTSYELTKSPTILYAGRIGLGIEVSLQLIAKAVQQVNNNLKLSIKFMLQTKEKPLWISDYECVAHNCFVSYNELPIVFAEADFLILPYDFSPQSIQYIRYSMPTKATEYMISGTPIIIFAPEETSIVNYAKKYGWAKVITENNISTLCQTITWLISNKVVRQHIAQNAIKIAEENHSSSKVTENFQKVIFSHVNKADSQI